MCDLKERVALITGGARGIGRGIALELALAGAAVAIADLDVTGARETASVIERQGGRAFAVALDVGEAASAVKCVEAVLQAFGHVDVLVNNAGVFQSRLGLDLSDEDFNRCLNVNLTGVWRMVQALVPQFRARGRGRIINIASVGGRRGVGFAPAYCAAKAAVINLSQSLATVLGSSNITVNTVCPGSIPTSMQEAIGGLLSSRGIDDEDSRSRSPLLAEPLTVEDIGHAVVFFASDLAKHITGQALNVDCGYLLN